MNRMKPSSGEILPSELIVEENRKERSLFVGREKTFIDNELGLFQIKQLRTWVSWLCTFVAGHRRRFEYTDRLLCLIRDGEQRARRMTRHLNFGSA